MSADVIPIKRRRAKPKIKDGAPIIPSRPKTHRLHHKRGRTHTYLYVIHCAGFYKVGLSKDPRARLVDLRNGCPLPIEVICSLQIKAGPHYHERLIHALLKDHRMHGEWFNAPLEKVRAAIDTALDVLADEEAAKSWDGTLGGTGQAVHNG